MQGRTTYVLDWDSVTCEAYENAVVTFPIGGRKFYHQNLRIIVFAQIPYFCTTIFFTLQAQSLFKQADVRLSLLQSNVSHSKCRLLLMFSIPLYFPAYFSLPSSMRSKSFLNVFLNSLMYIRPLFPINKQFTY